METFKVRQQKKKKKINMGLQHRNMTGLRKMLLRRGPLEGEEMFQRQLDNGWWPGKERTSPRCSILKTAHL